MPRNVGKPVRSEGQDPDVEVVDRRRLGDDRARPSAIGRGSLIGKSAQTGCRTGALSRDARESDYLSTLYVGHQRLVVLGIACG